MVKGSCVGRKKRIVIIRQALHAPVSHKAYGPVNLKFIDTSSKFGHGRFQTKEEKNKFYVKRKTKHSRKVRNKDLGKYVPEEQQNK